MSDDKTNQEVKTDQPKARKILGREEMFDVFKTGGEAELFARPAQKKHSGDSDKRTGPSINHQIHDASGPTIAHQMSDGVGPIIKKTEITDADGPTINHQMSDANGPVIKRVLENTIVKLPTIPNPVASITKTDVQSSEHQPENSSVSEPAHRVDTFSVHMAERIAKMKSEQKETKTKMDDLEADTQKMQVKLTKK